MPDPHQADPHQPPGRPDTARPGPIPVGGRSYPARIEEIARTVDTETAILLGDDPILGLGVPAGTLYDDGEPVRLPVALFEPRQAIGATHPDGTLQEFQAEMIIQAGFHRWRPVTTFDTLPDWTVRQTRTGLELWDHAGLWARGPVTLTTAWLAAAQRLGQVLAVYGVRVGVRPPDHGRWGPAERAAELRDARAAGLVAAALVPWRPAAVPEETRRYAGPSYDPATGQVTLGVGAEDTTSTWQLHTPGAGMEHGLILGGPGTGKTNILRILNAEAVQTDRFHIWPADPTGNNKATVWSPVADRLATTPKATVDLLEAAVDLLTTRLTDSPGSWTEPTPVTPGILITLDEAHHVLAGNPHATALAERIATTGGPAGIGLVATSRGPDPAYFGGSTTLRDALARTNCAAYGLDALDLLDRLRTP